MMEIHYWWVTIYIGLSCIVLLRGTQAAAVEPTTDKEHDFDLGPLKCCARPRVSDICPGMSEYIPFTISREMEGREIKINSQLLTYPPFIEDSCTESVRETLCEQNFPTCVINPDGIHEVLLPARNTCKQKLKDVCSWFSDQDIEQICSVYKPKRANYPVGDCSATNITFNHCIVDWYVPEWILQYVKQIDIKLDNARNSRLQYLHENCWEKFTTVRCKSVGRCWALGDRLEHIISTETCNEALSCLNDDDQRIYGPILGCNLLPSENGRLVTTPTDITLSATTEPSTTIASSTAKIEPDTTTSNSNTTLPLRGDSSSTTSVLLVSSVLTLLTLSISLLV